MAATSWRLQIADRRTRHRDPQRRLRAGLVDGVPGQLPASAGIHPAAFGWLNTKGALGILSALAPSQAVNGVLADHDPVLVVFDGKPEQIHVASRTRLSGAIIDAMMLESLGRTLTVPQSNTTRH